MTVMGSVLEKEKCFYVLYKYISCLKVNVQLNIQFVSYSKNGYVSSSGLVLHPEYV